MKLLIRRADGSWAEPEITGHRSEYDLQKLLASSPDLLPVASMTVSGGVKSRRVAATASRALREVLEARRSTRKRDRGTWAAVVEPSPLCQSRRPADKDSWPVHPRN